MLEELLRVVCRENLEYKISMGSNRQLKREFGKVQISRRGEPYIPISERVRGFRGEQVYQFRRMYGVSRPAVAKSMHISEITIYLWERGRGEPSEIMWRAFLRIRNNYRLKLRRRGIDLDGGPVMEK